MKPKRLPRLWCAMQGLLPIDACVAAQQGELAWPREESRPVETRTTRPAAELRKRKGKART